jgi:hypothetical protein
MISLHREQLMEAVEQLHKVLRGDLRRLSESTAPRRTTETAKRHRKQNLKRLPRELNQHSTILGKLVMGRLAKLSIRSLLGGIVASLGVLLVGQSAVGVFGAFERNAAAQRVASLAGTS